MHSEETQSIKSRHGLPYSIPCPSISKVTASETETIHSASDTESEGIPILQEAIDTKPNQILVYTRLIDKLSVQNLSRNSVS